MWVGPGVDGKYLVGERGLRFVDGKYLVGTSRYRFPVWMLGIRWVHVV